MRTVLYMDMESIMQKSHWDIVIDWTWERKKRSWVQSFKPVMLVFIPWDAAKVGLLIYLYLLRKIFTYLLGKKCLWGKVSRSGRSLGDSSDHSADLIEGSFRLKYSVLQGRLQGWWREGPLSSSYPSEENYFSQNWAYVISLLRVYEKCGLCAKEDGEFRMYYPGFPSSKSLPQETWEAHIHGCHTWNTEKICDHEKVRSYTKNSSQPFSHF